MSGLSIDLYKAIRDDALPTGYEVDGRKYTIRGITPVYDPTPAYFGVNTLTGLVDYLKADVDNLAVDKLICHVVSPEHVSVFSALHGAFQQRDEFIRAVMPQKYEKLFGVFRDTESFNIWLQSGFADMSLTFDGKLATATDKGLILKYVGNIRDSAVRTIGDNGVSQEVTVRTGVASIENVILPNPVTLRPYRTFNEVEQPVSSFVFRAQDGPKFALVEADNGAWKGVAMKNIKAFLEYEVPGLHVIA
jgi:hypothetical protein